MPVYPVSVSADSADAVLIVGLNWLGDSIMSMPAIQAYRQAYPRYRLVMLAKAKQSALWTLQDAVDEIKVLPENIGGMLKVAREISAGRFRTAFILPNSFRAALVPFLAHVPQRIGLPGHARDWMLTEVVRPTTRLGQVHQSHEYLALFGMQDRPSHFPSLHLSDKLLNAVKQRWDLSSRSWVALMPGAAYGPAKRWPAQSFIQLGEKLKNTLNYGIVLLGLPAERELCEQIAQAIGPGSVNLAGQTPLPELAAVLAHCALVVANDSGGMHLAAAVGTPVLAIFGITDPQKTGPLGPLTRVLQASARRSRDIARTSCEAEFSLSRIQPQQAWEAAQALLAAAKS